ncbi:hypothetical protein SIN8267_01082 [Sinobacterium norvegicum]|uniref:DUF2846 domain-containing protein n=1 Tax=Sinobacterium norvegicum TaxID=1641715 RepID=A0ABN8EF04_9GAMM|nr:DUF2846 domain-containing protein [Sinobacterium norvegicum]CAH0990981.1 hypothetical protein SIN8267_01082 [Sinobacterium norvegicum]
MNIVKTCKGIVLALAAFSALSGCTASGPKFSGLSESELTPDSKKSYIYLYRDNQFVGSAGVQPASIDNNICVKLKNGGYWSFEVESGQHTVALLPTASFDKFKKPEITFPVAEGEVVFVKHTLNMDDLVVTNAIIMASGTIGLAVIEPSFALNELQKTNLHSERDYCSPAYTNKYLNPK